VTKGNSRPVVALAANDSWNIVNYRAGLIRALQGSGLDVAVLAPPGKHIETMRALGADFLPVPMSPRGKSPLGDLRTLAAFRRQLRALRPVAVLGFTSKPNIYGSMAAHSLGIPVINNISGLGAVFMRSGPLTKVVSGLYRLALKRSSTVFFQNPDDRAVFEEQGIVDSAQSALLPGSGVNLERFAPRKAQRPEGPFTFLFAAQLLWDKGVGEYVEAARRLRAGRDDLRFRILWHRRAGKRRGSCSRPRQWVCRSSLPMRRAAAKW
jgi:glycosyltransferase involved in cell wall biosynthesis